MLHVTPEPINLHLQQQNQVTSTLYTAAIW